MPLTPFIPVKITDQEWAERLLAGEIFMQSLHAFGSWSVLEQNRSGEVKNLYRGDLHEGSVTIYKDPRDNAILSNSDPEFLDVIHDVTDIDIGDLQYFKIFSLYSMRYDVDNSSFFYPDSQIKSFGDTAIIIHDMESFLQRFLQQILKVHGELVTVLMDEVHYFDYQETMKLMPLFSKPKSYAYQNELRLAIGLMEPNIYSLDFTNSVIRSTEPFKLNIGDVSDIACVLPIDDFLQLRLPKDLEWKFPTTKSKAPSIFDQIVQHTKEALESRESTIIKQIATIR